MANEGASAASEQPEPGNCQSTDQASAVDASAGSNQTPTPSGGTSGPPFLSDAERRFRIEERKRVVRLELQAHSLKPVFSEAPPTADERAAIEFTTNSANRISISLAKFSVWTGAAAAAGVVLLAPNLETFAGWIGAPMVMTGVTFLGLTAFLALVSRYFEVRAEAVQIALELAEKWQREERLPDPMAFGYALAGLQPRMRQRRILQATLRSALQPQCVARDRVSLTYWQMGVAVAQGAMLTCSVALMLYGLYEGMGVTWGRGG